MTQTLQTAMRATEHAAPEPARHGWSGAEHRIAAIVPCHNEQGAIGKVVQDLTDAVPGVLVYVYDNCSTDNTVEEAREAGAIVRSELRKGKGNVVRRAFADIEADIYLLIDGDDTYDAQAAPELIDTLLAGPYDHVVGTRRAVEDAVEAYRPAHEFGNRMLNHVVSTAFGDSGGDMLSGYRAFSRRFVKTFPAASHGFEIETELTVHSQSLRLPTAAVEVGFKDRAEGTESKLRTFHDGFRILRLITSLYRHERPVVFYGIPALLGLFAATALLGAASTGLTRGASVTAVALALTAMSLLALIGGFVLDGIRRSRHEHSRLTYLAMAPVAVPRPVPVSQPNQPTQPTMVVVPDRRVET